MRFALKPKRTRVKKMSRLHEINLPINRDEAISIIKSYVFGPVKTFTPDGFNIVKPKEEIECNTYAIVDAMLVPEISFIPDAYDAEWECLWKGESEGQFAFYAPYIVKLDKGSALTNWFISSKLGTGKEWGMFVRSYHSIKETGHHLRKFNQLYDEVNGKWVFFRYYSTVAIDSIIPALPPDDFASFFSGISQIISDGSDGRLLII